MPGENLYDDLKTLLTETVSEYLAELMKLSEHCGFGTIISDIVRDRLVGGISDESILHKLLAEKELTLAKAIAIA